MNFLRSITLIDILDILVLATVLYQVILIFQRTRATQLLLGIFYFAVLFFIAFILRMTATIWVFERLIGLLAIALLIIFQPELRNIFERAGRRGFLLAIHSRGLPEREEVERLLDTIVQALEEMSEDHTGALIVLEREISLTEYMNTGERINAEISKDLIKGIFYKGNPLHDGAVIIREGRIAAAHAFLPLTDSKDLPSHLGTRHRAAMGITEISDSISLVASEETGHLSLFHSGKPAFRLTPNTMRLMARGIILPDYESETPYDQLRQGFHRYFRIGVKQPGSTRTSPKQRDSTTSGKVKIPATEDGSVSSSTDKKGTSHADGGEQG